MLISPASEIIIKCYQKTKVLIQEHTYKKPFNIVSWFSADSNETDLKVSVGTRLNLDYSKMS